MQSISIDSLWEIGRQEQGKRPVYIVVLGVFYQGEKLKKVFTRLFLTTSTVVEILDNEDVLPAVDEDELALVYYYENIDETRVYFFYNREAFDEIQQDIPTTSAYTADVVTQKKVISPGDIGVSVNIRPKIETSFPEAERSLYSLPGFRSWQV